MVKAIFFDLFRTLAIWPGPDPEEDMIREFNLQLSYLEVERIFAATDLGEYKKSPDFYGQEIMNIYRKKVVSGLGLEVTDANLERLEKILVDATSRAKIDPDAEPVVRELRERGYQIGLITAAWPHPIKRFFVDTSLGNLFDLILNSCETGYVKPDRKIFEVALKELGIKASEAAMVGDSLRADIKGAKSVGMITVLYDQNHEYAEKPAEADYKIKSLREILGFF